MKTYTTADLRNMTDTLNTVSANSMDALLSWRYEIQELYTGLRRTAYIYCRTVGSIEFIETVVGTDEFKFVDMYPVEEGADLQDIYKAAEYLKLV